ncbi:serine hydrolase domain-containing protein [Sphingomonas canadensis]|uniref:Serine hydrolase domain-containing protein n=1 Tax=Sphingomonas canadensis TaxID=1219257 RepID=A0ABW3H2G5_9SPHN|nr:serine hydrolase domain-containing protein [Sphingomonas canadensis]MCW3834531.1 beta-lactamase family protein [Sphingomonas canadensis]
MTEMMGRRAFGAMLAGTCFSTMLPAPGLAATGDRKRLAAALDTWLARIVDNGWVSGAAVRIEKAGAAPLTRLHGFADREARTPLGESTIYRIYSMTKPVTAACMMTLVEDGKVALDQPVRELLPEWSDPQVLVRFDGDKPVTEPAKRPITVRHLLTHTSGLSESFNKGFEPSADLYHRIGLIAGQFRPALGITSLKRYSEVLATIPLAFQPGEKWLYSSGLEVAGRVIEAASGRDYESYLRARLLQPLGMADTHFALPASKRPRLAAMYVGSPDGKTARLNPPMIPAWGEDSVIPMGGSGLFSTLGDYTRFAQMLIGRGRLGRARVLRAESVTAMMTNQLPPALGDMPLSAAARFGLGGEVKGLGFGLGGSVLVDPAAAGGMGHRGEYAWGGAASTTFWVDPVTRTSVVLMTQKLPSGIHPLRDELRRLVYGRLP